jgi:hypothetical protein
MSDINNFKLYELVNDSLKKHYKSYLFLHLGNDRIFNIPIKTFINIKSGTLVTGALWGEPYDIKEVEITKEHKVLINKIINKIKPKN